MPIINCQECSKEFNKIPCKIERSNLHFCSFLCHKNYIQKEAKIKNKVICKQCQNEFYKVPSEQKITKNNFCSKSCAATYNNTHKTHGTRVSKLEKYLQEELIKLYDYDFHFNRKDTINSELDIYIPELKLAFELNGVFHYEPIFGEEKLSQIQNNDDRKFQACIEKQIGLCIIDTSWIKYNKISNFQKILDIINEVIHNTQNNF
jgi:hypothetical protein